MTSVDSNFNFLCGRPHGTVPLLPPSTCVHLSLTPSLRVDVINGWPLNTGKMDDKSTSLYIYSNVHINSFVNYLYQHAMFTD